MFGFIIVVCCLFGLLIELLDDLVINCVVCGCCWLKLLGLFVV